MSQEDECTLWCGNLSEKVTEELLYELFVQAGPVEMVKIPKDNEKRQRSYAFITYAHAVSVEYAINIFEGTKLFQRALTLHKKTKNGPNPAASPKVNFNSNQQQHRGNSQQNHQQTARGHTGNTGQSNNKSNDDIFAKIQGMVANMNKQTLAGLGHAQQNPLLTKMTRQNQHHHKPYSREEKKPYSRDRNDSSNYSRDWGGNNRNRGDNNQRRNRGRRS